MAYIYDIADVWAASGTVFTGIKLNVTDTASAAGSLLMDLQVGGSSKFSVLKGGQLGVQRAPISAYAIAAAGTIYAAQNLVLGGDTSAISMGTLGDINLIRDAANTLAQRNGPGVAQAFNLYNTYDNSANYERGFMRFVSNALRIGTEKLGTGTARALEFQTDGVARLTLATTGEASFAGRVSAITNALSYSAPTYGFGSCGISAAASSPALYFHTPSFGWAGMGASGSGFNGGLLLGFTAGDPSNTSIDAAFARDSADTIAQRRGTNAQTSRIYGTFTDASNYRRLTNTMNTAGVAEIKPEGAGTGASGNVLHISGLPTSNPGPGILWNNAGTPAIGT